MLTTYLTQTRRLLQFPSGSNSLYDDDDLTAYINTARNQLAGEAECIVFQATLPLVANQRVYNFSAFSLAGGVGIASVMNVRQILVGIGTGYVWIRSRPWEWFTVYKLNNPNPQTAQPNTWSQYGQGVNGTIYVDPVPGTSYTALADTICLPVALVDDTTPEAIPPLWQDAVPFFAAYYAFLSAQSAARQADADRMMKRYEEFVSRARGAATSSVLPGINRQTGNPVRANQLGLQPVRGAGG